MVVLLKKRWVQYVLGFAALFVAGMVVASIVLKEDPIPIERPDRLVLNADNGDQAAELALTAAEAVLNGWKDPVLCYKGSGSFVGKNVSDERLGRYFHNESAGETPSYLSIYNETGELLGVYLISPIELPAPWKHQPEGLQNVLTSEHWGLPLYVRETKEACGERKLIAGSG